MAKIMGRVHEEWGKTEQRYITLSKWKRRRRYSRLHDYIISR